MATLVSTSEAMGCSALVGMSETTHGLVVDDVTARGDDETSALLDESLGGRSLDADARAVSDHIDRPRGESDLVAERLGDHEAAGPVDGGAHGMRLPSLMASRWHR